MLLVAPSNVAGHLFADNCFALIGYPFALSLQTANLVGTMADAYHLAVSTSCERNWKRVCDYRKAVSQRYHDH
jgi:hypothetical protein